MIKALKWTGESPDPNPAEHLCGVLERAVDRRCPHNPKHFHKEDSANITKLRCATMKETFPKTSECCVKTKNVFPQRISLTS